MATGPTSLYDRATALLTAVGTIFATAGVSLPTEQYVTAVQPVAECDTVAVCWDNIAAGWPGQPEEQGALTEATTYFAVLSVWIFRCLQAIPTGSGQSILTAPTDTQFQTDATTIMTDAYTLFHGLRIAKYQQPPWFGDFTTAVKLGPCLPVAADGGFSGVTMTVAVELT